MKNPIEKNSKIERNVRFGTAALALTLLGGTVQLPIKPIVEKVYATEIENTSNQEEIQILEDSLKYAYSFCKEAGGNIIYIDSSKDKGRKRNQGKLEKGYSDCSWFVYRIFEHTGVMDEFVRSEKWGFNGCPGTSVVAEFKAKAEIDLSNASPRRYILVAWW